MDNFTGLAVVIIPDTGYMHIFGDGTAVGFPGLPGEIGSGKIIDKTWKSYIAEELNCFESNIVTDLSTGTKRTICYITLTDELPNDCYIAIIQKPTRSGVGVTILMSSPDAEHKPYEKMILRDGDTK